MPAVAAVHSAGVKTIDLSADFRLSDTAVYQRWYNHTHNQGSAAGRRSRSAGTASRADQGGKPRRQSGLLRHQHHPLSVAAGEPAG